MVYHTSITINHEIDDRLSNPRTPTITHDCAPICRHLVFNVVIYTLSSFISSLKYAFPI